MTKAQLKLANELNKQINKKKKARKRRKKAFDKVVLLYQKSKTTKNAEIKSLFKNFPFNDTLKYHEKKVTTLDESIKELEQKFLQL